MSQITAGIHTNQAAMVSTEKTRGNAGQNSRKKLITTPFLRRQPKPKKLERVFSKETRRRWLIAKSHGKDAVDDAATAISREARETYVGGLFGVLCCGGRSSRGMLSYMTNEMDITRETRCGLRDVTDADHGVLLIKSYCEQGNGRWFHFVRKCSGNHGSLAKKLRLRRYDEILAIDLEIVSDKNHEDMVALAQKCCQNEQTILHTRRFHKYSNKPKIREISITMRTPEDMRTYEFHRTDRADQFVNMIRPLVHIQVLRGSIKTRDGRYIIDIKLREVRPAHLRCNANNDFVRKEEEDICVSPLHCGDKSFNFNVHLFVGTNEGEIVDICLITTQDDELLTIDSDGRTLVPGPYNKDQCDLENMDFVEGEAWMFQRRRLYTNICTFESFKYKDYYVACVETPGGSYDIQLVKKTEEDQINIQFQQFDPGSCQRAESDSSLSSVSSISSASSASKPQFHSSMETLYMNVTDESEATWERREVAFRPFRRANAIWERETSL